MAQHLPLAEDCGLIGPIGQWVINEACRQAKAWQLKGLPPVRVAVNLSGSQFRQDSLLMTIRQALNDAQLDPTYLEVELTESAVMLDPEESVAILEQLSRMGVLVSVDDFGTGYAAIVRAILSLAHSLRLKLVAEGVETAAQLDFLKFLGCDQYQGFHFSTPVSPDVFEEMLRRLHAPESAPNASESDRTHSKLAVYRTA